MIARCAIITATFLAASLGFAESASSRHLPKEKRIADSVHHQPPYAALVIDFNSGKVLHESNADDRRHPASLTKIMTLYLLFEQLETGKLKLDSPLQVSTRAARQGPAKIGLKANQTNMVEDAIKGLVTKSANDAPVVISESIGGTEGEFAALMTQKAKALGMASTNYVNASGLPDHKQITTARDQVILARAIQDRFPSYYRFFATRSFRYNGVVMHNSNSLLAQVKGIDGIKTGYTKASGYNLVVSVRRNGKHIVMVMLGGTSKAARDARMRELIENHIIHASSIEGADAFALSPTPALVEVQPPATEPQEESQQKEASQTTSDQEKSSSNAEPVKSQESAALLNGALAVFAATSTDSVPAKFSDKNAANDRLATAAYTFKLLSPGERSAVYQMLKEQPCGGAAKVDIGTKLPLAVELRSLPDELMVRVPQIKGYQYIIAGDEILLVSPLNRMVVGAFPK